MAGVAIAGRLATLRVSDDGGTTYENYGGVVDITLNINVDELECTTHDSAGSREYLPNHDDATIDVSGRWLDGDAGQEIVLAAIFAKTTLLFEFTMQTLAGKKEYTGSCFATSANPSGPLDDTGAMDVTFRVSGLTQSVQ